MNKCLLSPILSTALPTDKTEPEKDAYWNSVVGPSDNASAVASWKSQFM